jgi:exodeoxyribonuclease V alpha subunit
VDVPDLPTERDVWAEVRRLVGEHGSDVQYIAWQNAHCATINALVQAAVHGGPVAGGLAKGDRVVYVGVNKADAGLTNAMTGVVSSVPSGAGRPLPVVWEDGVTRAARATDVQLAYCITVHKAQGSEFGDVCVVALALDTMRGSLDRRWLYTAATRAKDRLRLAAPAGLDTLVADPVRRQSLMALSFTAL